MYGLVNKFKAQSGQRDALLAILLDSTGELPGCFSYVVAKDAKDPDVIWVTEVWESKESHQASLATPAVKDAIGRGKPLIADLGDHFETVPVGGVGLPAR